jgi:hypothetical protein
MEPEGSIPCSQEPSTGPYLEPHQSNPHHPAVTTTIINTMTLENVKFIVQAY